MTFGLRPNATSEFVIVLFSRQILLIWNCLCPQRVIVIPQTRTRKTLHFRKTKKVKITLMISANQIFLSGYLISNSLLTPDAILTTYFQGNIFWGGFCAIEYQANDIFLVLTITEIRLNETLKCARFCGFLHAYPIWIIYFDVWKYTEANYVINTNLFDKLNRD